MCGVTILNAKTKCDVLMASCFSITTKNIQPAFQNCFENKKFADEIEEN
jgi:hypothetical protein